MTTTTTTTTTTTAATVLQPPRDAMASSSSNTTGLIPIPSHPPPPPPPTLGVVMGAMPAVPAVASAASAAREKRRRAARAASCPGSAAEYTDFALTHPDMMAPGRRSHVLGAIGCALETVFNAAARKNDRLPADTKLITAFHSVSVPSISIQTYFKRLTEFIDCSPECCVLAMVHINRIHTSKPAFMIDSLTIHRLLLTSLMVSAKFFDDHVYTNAQWSNIGGVSVKELAALERDFLSLLEYKLWVSTDNYIQTYNELCNPLLHVKCVHEATCKAALLYGHHPREAPLAWGLDEPRSPRSLACSTSLSNLSAAAVRTEEKTGSGSSSSSLAVTSASTRATTVALPALSTGGSGSSGKRTSAPPSALPSLLK